MGLKIINHLWLQICEFVKSFFVKVCSVFKSFLHQYKLIKYLNKNLKPLFFRYRSLTVAGGSEIKEYEGKMC